MLTIFTLDGMGFSTRSYTTNTNTAQHCIIAECKQKSTKSPRTHTPSSYFVIPELSNMVPFSVKSLGYDNANDITWRNALFKTFKIEIKNFKILKPTAGHKKVPSYAVELSKRPLHLVSLSL
jgi:hypothetical protein